MILFTEIMYILIFSVMGIVVIKLIHDKIKYGRFFEEEVKLDVEEEKQEK